MTRIVRRTPRFLRDFKAWIKPRPGSAAAVTAVVDQLAADAAAPSLQSHKLHGALAGSWACTVDYDLRIVYDIVEEDGEEVIVLLALGTHDQVY